MYQPCRHYRKFSSGLSQFSLESNTFSVVKLHNKPHIKIPRPGEKYRKKGTGSGGFREKSELNQVFPIKNLLFGRIICFVIHPKLQQSAFGEVLMIEVERIQGLPVQAALLDVAILFRVVVGLDNEFLSGIILGRELDTDNIEYGRSNLIDRLHRASSFQAK